jgi:molybdopterin/thiamine biosynthesis adenylyltransferase
MERYQRQITLKEFGLKGQQKLQQSKVVLIGLGGLGAIASMSLEAMGLQHLSAFDADVVHESNLHRQIMYQSKDIGLKKADVARQYFFERNPDLSFRFHDFDFSVSHANLLEAADLVLDASDRFETRYLLDDCCREMQIPLLSVSLFRFEIQMVLLHSSQRQDGFHTGLKELFGNHEHQTPVMNCSEAGILGSTALIGGALMAQEAVKFLCMPHRALNNELLYFNTLNFESRKISYGS